MKGYQNSGKWIWLSFLIWPLMTVMISLKNYRTGEFKNILWLFCVFFGFTMVFSSEGQDAERYISALEYMHEYLSGIPSLIEYIQEKGAPDVIQIGITYFVSWFTDDPRFLFAIYGAFFGYFYSRNIGFILERCEGKLTTTTTLLLWSVSMVIGIWMINGFRFWTAAHIYIWAVFNIFYGKRSRGYWLLVLAGFTHFSFILPILILVAYRFFGSYPQLYFLFFISTFLIQEINVVFVKSILEQLPGVFKERTIVYVGDAVLNKFENKETAYNWYIYWAPKLMRYLIILGSIILIRSKTVFQNIGKRFIGFVFLFSGIANLGALLPSGGRFVVISNFLLLTIFIWQIQNDRVQKGLRTVFSLAMPIIILFLIVKGRYLMGAFSPTTLLANPIIASIYYVDIAVIDLIK